MRLSPILIEIKDKQLMTLEILFPLNGSNLLYFQMYSYVTDRITVIITVLITSYLERIQLLTKFSERTSENFAWYCSPEIFHC